MGKRMFVDSFGDTLQVSKEPNGSVIITMNPYHPDDKIDFSVHLDDNGKWELIEFLSR